MRQLKAGFVLQNEIKPFYLFKSSSMSSAVVIVFLVLFLFLSFYISVCLHYFCNPISQGHKILKCLQENITFKKRIDRDIFLAEFKNGEVDYYDLQKLRRILVAWWGRWAQHTLLGFVMLILQFSVQCFVNHCLSVHCIFCPFSIHGFSKSHRYLQTFLNHVRQRKTC